MGDPVSSSNCCLTFPKLNGYIFKGILEEDGIIPNGLMDDIKELVNLAKELEFDENQSFFAKVEAVTEGRCNSKFMDTLLKNLRTATTSAEKQLGTSELLARYSFTQNVTNNNFWLQAHTVPLDY